MIYPTDKEYINNVNNNFNDLILLSLFLNKYIKPNPALTHKPAVKAPKPSPSLKNNSVIITEDEQFGIKPIIEDNKTDK